MKGYFAFPPPSASTSIHPELPKAAAGACMAWHTCHVHPDDAAPASKMTEEERRQRQEHERTLGECSEIAWVRAGGVLRDAHGRRDKARTERIRQELALQDVEQARMAQWEAYEARWRATQRPIPSESESEPQTVALTFVAFPWPLGERVLSRDLGVLTRRAVSEFLFGTLAVRTNTTTKRERIRSALLRWHPDKISPMLVRVASEDVELVREGIHVVFGILKELQDAERTGAL